MSIRVIAISFSAMAAIATAQAGERIAVVNPAGHVVLTAPNVASAERIDAGHASQPCKSTQALSIDDARTLVVKIATEENFYPEFVLSVAKSESQFDSNALSDKGAFGLMQLTPETAQRFKVDLCDPAANVLGGVRFLRTLHAKYRNPLFILAAYNAGEEAVERSRGVPPFPETVRFVAQVVNDFYTWPRPDGSADRSSRAAASSALIEPVGAAAPGSSANPNPKIEWDGGFVMHID